jgi:predicted PurR-regulated permease PerM
MSKNIEVSSKTLFGFLAVVLTLWFLVQIGSIVLTLFVALILALGLSPLVDALCQKGLSRPLSVLVTYLVFILLLLGLFTVALTPMVNQTQKLIERLPFYATTIAIPGMEELQRQFVDSLAKEISSASGNVLRVTLGFFSNALVVVTILVLTFYFLIDLPQLKQRFIRLFSRGVRSKVEETINELEAKLGGWLRGQVFLMFVVGLAAFVGLSLIGVEYALSLALIAGLLEIVPIVGPLISVVPALIVAAAVSPLTVLLVALLYLLIQQAENNLLVPKVMEKAVGFSPLVTLIAILIGGKLLGVLGALLAVPATLLFYTISKSVLTLDFD